MTSDRCPTCDELAHELDLLRADIAEHLPTYDIATQGGEPEHANPREVVEYAGDELRRASVTGHELIDAVTNILAATKEP